MAAYTLIDLKASINQVQAATETNNKPNNAKDAVSDEKENGKKTSLLPKSNKNGSY